MPTPITFPAFTDEDILWRSKDEANDFFNAIRVPDASPGTPGGVLQGDAVADAVLPSANASFFNVYIDEALVGTAPTLTNYNELKAAHQELKTQFNTLLTKLRDAGIIAT